MTAFIDQIEFEDITSFKVQYTTNDENGVVKSHSFRLTCLRLDEDAIQAKLKGNTEASMVDFMVDVIKDWGDVRSKASNGPVPYSEEAYRKHCKLAGIGRIAFNTYLFEVGAKAKN